jgi:hypothetical protein
MNSEQYQQLRQLNNPRNHYHEVPKVASSGMNARRTSFVPGHVMSSEEARAAASANAASLQDEVRRQLIVLQQQQKQKKKNRMSPKQTNVQEERHARLQKLSIRRESSLNQELLERVFPKPRKDDDSVRSVDQRQSSCIIGDNCQDCRGGPAHSISEASSPSQVPSLQIEISTGMFAPLRGAEETLAAVEDGNVEQCECVCCSTKLICIADAKYVLCPECRVIIPWQSSLTQSPFQSAGVGLGMTFQEYNSLVEQKMSGM